MNEGMPAYPQVVVSIVPIGDGGITITVSPQGIQDWATALQVLAEAVKIAGRKVVEERDPQRVLLAQRVPVVTG